MRVSERSLRRLRRLVLVLFLSLVPGLARAQSNLNITVTNSPATILTTTGGFRAIIYENSATPSAVFSVNGVNVAAGGSYVFTRPPGSPFSPGDSLGNIVATTSGPFTFILQQYPGPPVTSITPIKCPTAQFMNQLNADGSAVCGAVSSSGVSSISGDGSLITNSSTTGAAILTVGTAAAHKFWGNNTGSPATGSFVQPACADLSTAAASCSTDATNATNIASGTLNAARLPATYVPTSTTVNGHALSTNVTVTNADLGAVPTTTTVAGHALSSNVSIACGDLSNASTGCSATNVTLTIANGTSALGTSLISSGACASAVTTTATGTATTDNIEADFNADPTGVTGYAPSTGGMLTIIKYPTSGNVNFKVCNNTGSSITPGAITLNWRVVR